MASGAILVAVLALIMDGILALVQRLAVSPGLTGKFRNTGTTGEVVTTTARGDAASDSASSTDRADDQREALYEAHDPHDRGGRCRGARPRRLRRQQQPARTRGRWWRQHGLGRWWQHHRGFGRLLRVPGPRRDLRRRHQGQGHHGHDQAQHRQPRRLHQGAPGRLHRHRPGVHRFLADVPQGHRADTGPRRRLHRAQGDPAAPPSSSSTSRPPRTRTPWSSPRTRRASTR